MVDSFGDDLKVVDDADFVAKDSIRDLVVAVVVVP